MVHFYLCNSIGEYNTGIKLEPGPKNYLKNFWSQKFDKSDVVMIIYHILIYFVVFCKIESPWRKYFCSNWVAFFTKSKKKLKKTKKLLNKISFQETSSIIALKLSTYFLGKLPFTSQFCGKVGTNVYAFQYCVYFSTVMLPIFEFREMTLE